MWPRRSGAESVVEVHFNTRVLLGLAAVGVLGIALTGFGTGSSGPLGLSLRVRVPVNGATVVVPGVGVLGTVTPSTAVVTLRGRKLHVGANGQFQAHLHLHRGRNRISITAVAPRYHPIASQIVVRYRPGPAAPTPSLASRANAICSAAGDQGFALYDGAYGTSVLQTLKDDVNVARHMLSQLQAIRAPAQASATYASFLSAEQSSIGDAEMIVAAIKARALPELRRGVAQIQVASARRSTAARELGLAVCSER